MLDVSVSYNRFKFLGNEFLTWLWYVIENNGEELQKTPLKDISLAVGNRIAFEKYADNRSESITIKGDDASLEEGRLALKKGAVVIEINLCLLSENQKWQFNLKGESLNFSSLKTPATGAVELKEDIEGAIFEKIYLYEKAFSAIDSLYDQFIKIRVSEKWNHKVIPQIKKWIQTQNG